MIDPRGSDYRRYDGASLIKPNAAELAAVTGMQVEDDATVEAALRHLQARLGETETLIVTRGASGMSILGGDGKVHKVPAQRRTVFDVSGAGDTTLAALTLARLAGLSWFDAAQFATLCAGIAVSKAGTAVVSPDEIHEDMMRTPTAGADYLPLHQLAGTLQRWRVEGLRIGLTNGCFDVLHLGHLQALEGARRYCDRLVVALNDDESVRQLKGEGRPVNSLADRAGLLAGLRPVDLVTSFSGPTADAVVRAVKPDVYVKSGDYAPQTLPEAAAVREAGSEVIIVPFLEGRSTTAMLERARKG